MVKFLRKLFQREQAMHKIIGAPPEISKQPPMPVPPKGSGGLGIQRWTTQEAIKLLKAEGYLVVKIPECKHGEKSHGRHILLTKSASCPGANHRHGYVSTHYGTFGPWIRCECGYEFSDYYGDPETNWQKHREEYGVE